MKQLEKEAEAKRVAKLLTDIITTSKEITWQDNFSMTIRWKRYYSDKDSRDYSCIVFDDDANSNIANIYFYYCSDGTIEVNTQFWLLYNTELSVNTLLSVHKFIVKMAKAEGIEFTSEIDYEKFHES